MADKVSEHVSFGTAFEFLKAIRRPGHRQAMIAAGHDLEAYPAMRVIACHPSEPIGEVLDRVSDVEGEQPVFLAVRDGEGWALLTVDRPTRTTGTAS